MPERPSPAVTGHDARSAESAPALRIRAVVLTLAVVALVLAVTGLVTQYLWLDVTMGGAGERIPEEVARLFNLDAEGNVPTWFQGLLLLLCAAACGLASGAGAEERTRARLGWRMAAGIFVLLSCDEVASLHEAFGTWLGSIVGDALGIYAWLLGGIPFALAVGFALRRFVLDLPPRTRRGLLVAAAIYLGGAVGIEALEAFLDAYYYGSFVFVLLTVVEESLEMAGLIVLIGTVLVHLRAAGPKVRFQIR